MLTYVGCDNGVVRLMTVDYVKYLLGGNALDVLFSKLLGGCFLFGFQDVHSCNPFGVRNLFALCRNSLECVFHVPD